MLGNKPVDDFIELTNSLVDISKVALNDANPFLLFWSHVESLDRFFHCFRFLLQLTSKQRHAVFRINSICCKQVVFDIRCRYTEHIGDDSIQRHIAHSESILKTILFTGTHGYELAPIAGEFAKDANILAKDVTAGNQTHPEEVSDPFGILLIVLVALDSRNPFGICDDDVELSLKDIPNGNPVFAGAFHTDFLAVVVKEPLLKFKQVSV